MKKLTCLILLHVLFLNAIGQNAPSTFVVKFTDKNNSPFSVNSPNNYLSQRAIDRRTNQGIAMSDQDFPVNETYVNQVIIAGAQILNRSKWLNAVSVYCTDTLVMQSIQNLPFVQSVEAVKKPQLSAAVPKFEAENSFSTVPKLKKQIQTLITATCLITVLLLVR